MLVSSYDSYQDPYLFRSMIQYLSRDSSWTITVFISGLLPGFYRWTVDGEILVSFFVGFLLGGLSIVLQPAVPFDPLFMILSSVYIIFYSK